MPTVTNPFLTATAGVGLPQLAAGTAFSAAAGISPQHLLSASAPKLTYAPAPMLMSAPAFNQNFQTLYSDPALAALNPPAAQQPLTTKLKQNIAGDPFAVGAGQPAAARYGAFALKKDPKYAPY